MPKFHDYQGQAGLRSFQSLGSTSYANVELEAPSGQLVMQCLQIASEAMSAMLTNSPQRGQESDLFHAISITTSAVTLL